LSEEVDMPWSIEIGAGRVEFKVPTADMAVLVK